jgi:acetyl-CoA carboxylase biotin carboxyl carrier protein
MDLDQIKQLLDLVRQHELTEFEFEQDGLRLKIRKDGRRADGPPVADPAADVSIPAPQSAVVSPPSVTAGGAAEAIPQDEEVELAVVKSPIVGTFYRAAEPEAASFVEIGTSVKKGQVLCIIEAMKLMNEIDSEYDGQVVNIYVENGQPVQYGERLFAIRTA